MRNLFPWPGSWEEWLLTATVVALLAFVVVFAVRA
jgi:hypothetical protein